MATLVHNQSQLSGCAEPVTPTCIPTGNADFDALFGGYDPTNKLPYSENWSLDVQWQPKNDLVLTLAYIGNHGVHQPLPIPFNQPGIATPSKPINGQIYSYGFQPQDNAGNGLVTEQMQTTIGEFSFVTGIQLCARRTSVSIRTQISGKPKAFPTTTRCSCRRPRECLTVSS